MELFDGPRLRYPGSLQLGAVLGGREARDLKGSAHVAGREERPRSRSRREGGAERDESVPFVWVLVRGVGFVCFGMGLNVGLVRLGEMKEVVWLWFWFRFQLEPTHTSRGPSWVSSLTPGCQSVLDKRPAALSGVGGIIEGIC